MKPEAMRNDKKKKEEKKKERRMGCGSRTKPPLLTCTTL
jgi:hypothetical protein